MKKFYLMFLILVGVAFAVELADVDKISKIIDIEPSKIEFYYNNKVKSEYIMTNYFTIIYYDSIAESININFKQLEKPFQICPTNLMVTNDIKTKVMVIFNSDENGEFEDIIKFNAFECEYEIPITAKKYIPSSITPYIITPLLILAIPPAIVVEVTAYVFFMSPMFGFAILQHIEDNSLVIKDFFNNDTQWISMPLATLAAPITMPVTIIWGLTTSIFR